MFKKSLSLLLCLLLAFGVFDFGLMETGATDAEEPFIVLTADYNQSLSVELNANGGTKGLQAIQDSDIFDGTLRHVSDNKYSLIGFIPLFDGRHEFSAEGDLKTIKLTTGSMGLIGNFLGFTSDTNEHVNITVHAVPDKDKIFIFTTVGYLTQTTSIDTLIFGQQFDEMNELVEAFSPQEVALETDSSVVTNSAYNEQLRAIGYGAGELWTGEIVPMAAITFYSPQRVAARDNYKAWVKLNSHVSNAEYWTRIHYGFYTGVLSTWVSRGTCEFGSDNRYMEVSNLDPASGGWNVTLPIPWISASGQFDWSPWSFNIYLSRIDATKHKLSGSTYDNIARWVHNYSQNVDWSSAGPASTTIGYSGQSTIIFFNTPSSPVAVNMYAEGSISYNFQHQVGATITSGGFTVGTPTVNATIWAE